VTTYINIGTPTHQCLYVVRYLVNIFRGDVTVLEVADRTSESVDDCLTAVVDSQLQTVLIFTQTCTGHTN